MTKNRTDRLAEIACWLLPLLILGSILALRPHWGLMDDVTNIYSMVPKMREAGIFSYAWDYARNDIGWGMFRPAYPPMVYLVYAPGMATAAWVTFAWNALLVCAIIYFYAFVLARILQISLAPILLASAAFFYGHDLFQHPSLQEKLILLAGAGFTWHCWNRPRWRAASFWGVALAWFLFGVGAKASFAIHYCVAFMAFVAANRQSLVRRELRAWVETLFLAFLGMAMVVTFAYISRQGSYTSLYSGSKIVPNLLSIHGPLFLLPILAALAWLTFHWRETWERPEASLPVVGVSAFLTLFLPWGIQGYIQAVVVPLYAALLVQLAYWYLGKLPRALWLVPLALVALAVTGYRSLMNFGRLHDIGAIVAGVPQWEGQGVREIWMPCNEGSLSMERFFRDQTTPLTVKEISPAGQAQGKTILYDQAMCPFSGRVAFPADCNDPELIYRGTWRKSYRIVRCR